MNLPEISIIIRTCGRPNVLKRALESVRSQSYPAIEVVVVEDGANVSEQMIYEEFADLHINYTATGTKKGRCVAGNIALTMAKGAYINFLDDDDILLPQHIKRLYQALADSGKEAAYGLAEEHQIRITNEKQYAFQVKRKLLRYHQPFNRLLLCYMNYIPIQSILFSRKLYESYGGFDESLEVLEDWDLWLRYAFREDFVFVPQITSIYYVPYDRAKRHCRQEDLDRGLQAVHQKHREQILAMSYSDINRDVEYIYRYLSPNANSLRSRLGRLKRACKNYFHKKRTGEI